MGGFEDRKVLLGNQMQAELAKFRGKTIEEFIVDDAEGFRNLVKEHPEILENFEKDHDETLRRVGSIVFH